LGLQQNDSINPEIFFKNQNPIQHFFLYFSGSQHFQKQQKQQKSVWNDLKLIV